MIKVKLKEIQATLGNNVEIKVGYSTFKLTFQRFKLEFPSFILILIFDSIELFNNLKLKKTLPQCDTNNASVDSNAL